MAKSSSKQGLAQLYYDTGSTGAYGGIDRLLRSAHDAGLRVSRDEVVRFLQDQQSYSLHKPSRRHYKRNQTYVSRIDQQWQIDLADMQALASENDGNRYILTCIDVFSKYAWAIPVHDKSGKTVVAALEAILKHEEPARKPERIQSDKGTEFFNKVVQPFLKRHNIHHFASNSDQKAAVVERFNRTLKSRIWAYFTANTTKRYVDVLQKLVDGYNHSEHRAIGMRPIDVTQENSNLVWMRLYHKGKVPTAKVKSLPRKTISKGQAVRVNRWKGNFEKGYMPNWSREHFVVSSMEQQPRRVYKLEDTSGEPIDGHWYSDELQPIRENKFEVEKVIKRRGESNKRTKSAKEVLVKWRGWPDKFNSWIKESDLSNASKHTFRQPDPQE